MRWSGIRLLPALLAAGLSDIAGAADLPAPSAASVYSTPALVPGHNWSGIYFGIEGGAGLGQSQDINADPNTPSFVGLPLSNPFNVDGGLLGGTLGFNWQFANWVVGAEGDLSWVDQKGSGNDIPPFNVASVQTTDEKWLATGRLRLGMSPADRWLIYTTGGLAVASLEATVKSAAFGPFTDTKTELGWTAGGGVEFALSQNWSAKLEYLYVGLQTGTYFSPDIVVAGGGRFDTRTVSLNNNIVRAGINFTFK
jgi:outer membrane immunogenic protein